nr:hypothetical protein [Tanacetum cinerariifolium]
MLSSKLSAILYIYVDIHMQIRRQKRIYLLLLDQMSNVPCQGMLTVWEKQSPLGLQKLQKNPIFCISGDILHNTNFFKSFSTSANVSSIYIQQFCNTLTQEAKTGAFRTNVDYAELIWEEFVQGIQTFFTHRDSNKIPSKKPTPHVIPYCWFTKLIIYYLGSKCNIHRRPKSPRHVTGDDFLLRNLKFIPKGERDEVFRMKILEELITDNIRNAPYYNAYLEMVEKYDMKIAAEKGTKKKSASKAVQSKKPKTAKQSIPAPAKKPKITQEKPSKPLPAKKASKGKMSKVRKGKSSLQLVDEEEQT